MGTLPQRERAMILAHSETKVGNTLLSCCLLFIATLFEPDFAESWGIMPEWLFF